MRPFLAKGVPSLFSDLKPLYRWVGGMRRVVFVPANLLGLGSLHACSQPQPWGRGTLPLSLGLSLGLATPVLCRDASKVAALGALFERIAGSLDASGQLPGTSSGSAASSSAANGHAPGEASTSAANGGVVGEDCARTWVLHYQAQHHNRCGRGAAGGEVCACVARGGGGGGALIGAAQHQTAADVGVWWGRGVLHCRALPGPALTRPCRAFALTLAPAGWATPPGPCS